MTHARETIRTAFVTALDGETDAGNKVFNSRVYPLNANSLPGLVVYTPQEQVTTDTIGYPRRQTRELQVVVEAYSKTVNEADKVIDDLGEQIEKAIAADPGLGGNVKDTMLAGVQVTLAADGDVPVAVGIFTYTVLYQVRENAPDNLI